MSGMSIGGADTLDGQDGADKLYGGYTMLDNTVGGNGDRGAARRTISSWATATLRGGSRGSDYLYGGDDDDRVIGDGTRCTTTLLVAPITFMVETDWIPSGAMPPPCTTWPGQERLALGRQGRGHDIRRRDWRRCDGVGRRRQALGEGAMTSCTATSCPALATFATQDPAARICWTAEPITTCFGAVAATIRSHSASRAVWIGSSISRTAPESRTGSTCPPTGSPTDLDPRRYRRALLVQFRHVGQGGSHRALLGDQIIVVGIDKQHLSAADFILWELAPAA